MVNLEKYFSVIFDSGKQVSNINLKRFTEKHLAALVHNNVGGKYDTIIALTSTAFNNFFGNVEDKDLANALQKSRTLTNDNAFEQFKTAVDKHYNFIAYKFPQDTPEYLEFFPQGKSEYTQMTKGIVEVLMERMIDACTTHVAEITQPIVDEFTAIRDLYNNSRDEQLQQMEEKDLESTEISETRNVLEFQLNKNLLILATEYLGNVQRGMDFFDQQYLGVTSSGGGDSPTPPPPPPPATETIVIATKQNPPAPFSMEFMGTVGEETTIEWGDGTSDTITMDGSFVSISHTYPVIGNYTISITGAKDAFIEMQALNGQHSSINLPEGINLRGLTLNDNQFSSLFIPATYTDMIALSAANNDIDQQSINLILTTINDFGTSNGVIYLNGGNNQAPSGQGIAAMNQLIARGWTVVTN